ncbi:PAS domain-containing sensor histidine kinase [Deinococcus humi]|uniref:histidine kinase n=1 Tax=Deinococcus humi TaxID=662880 RepID=A0A7W8K1K9_9DEIO|nr:PAS domain-containing protein [Deinococcus humi]MBB5365801.1 PAS domain S-box-containing protein [Deinococcus humi]GGO39283.1 hypothetical protein GCM10008949_47130 [Deinococcus humi]
MLFDPAHISESSVGLEDLLNTLPSMTWCADAHGLTTFVNRDLLAFTGRSPEAFLQQRFAVAVHPEDRDGFQKCWEQSWMDVMPFHCEFRLEHHDGTYRWIRSEARSLHAKTGEVMGWIGSCTQIDDLKIAQQQANHHLQRLERNEERFRALVQATHQTVWSAVPYGAPQVDSQGWPGLLGQHPGLGPDAWLDLVHPEDVLATAQAVEQANTQRTPYVVEHRLRQPDGSYRLMLGRAFPLQDADGRITEWIGMHTDITEDRRREQVLRDSEQRYRALFEAMPNIVWMSSREGQVQRFNEHWHRFTGLPTEPHGLSWLDAVHPEDRPAAVQARTEGLRTGQAYELEVRLRRHDGVYRWHACQIAPFSSGVASDESGWLGYAVHIHERKLAELSIQRSEARFRSLVTASSQVVWITTPEGLASSSQPAWEELTGQDCEASRGQGWTEAIHPDDRAEVIQAWNEALRTRTTYQLKHRLRTPEGTYRWYLARAVPVWEPEGLVREWVGIHADIHEQKLGEFSRLRLERLVNESDDLIGLMDLGGQFEYLNPVGLRLLEREEGSSWTWEDITVPAAQHQLRTQIYPALLSTGHWLGDLDLQHEGTGQRLPVNASLMLINDPTTGQPVNIAITARDIRERQRDRARLARLVEASSDYIGIANREHRIMYVNRAGRALVGLGEHDPLGEIFTVVHESDRERFETQILPEVDRNGCWQGDLKLRHTVTGEAIPVWRTIFTLTDPSTGLMDGYGTITRDMRDRLAVERDLQRSNTELQRSLAELEQFAYVASHDLQEPLRTVTSFSELLVNRYADQFDERGHLYARLITEATTRLGTLLQDLQTYARVASARNEAEPVDTQLVLAQVFQTLEMEVQGTRAQLHAGALPTVTGHAAQLRQVFVNLIGNALKFRAPDRAPFIQVDAVREEEAWRFSVSDNGLGIAPEFHERIFTIFQRLHTREKYEGNGIGLSVARKIVERQGGRLWLESTPGSGTTFFFTWPVKGRPV